MRLGRLAFILFAIYLVFIGGSAYYTLIFPVRIAHQRIPEIRHPLHSELALEP